MALVPRRVIPQSVSSVFAPARPLRKHPLNIGAVKANVGHGKAAAGIMALIKTLRVFKNNQISPHAGVKTALNPLFPNLEKRNIKIPWAATTWERSTRKPYAVVNNFSAAKGNTTLVLEEPPL
jgi:acyl transferase domain-containing protein